MCTAAAGPTVNADSDYVTTTNGYDYLTLKESELKTGINQLKTQFQPDVLHGSAYLLLAAAATTAAIAAGCWLLVAGCWLLSDDVTICTINIDATNSGKKT